MLEIEAVKQPELICLMGPTASGKTALALLLAKEINAEIISVDSGMIYRSMDIGTAKPSKEELAKVPHHLIDICDPSESYSAGKFRRDALKIIAEILERKKIPLLVGGTMLYFKALQDGIATLPEADTKLREKLKREYQKNGAPAMHQKLQAIDPQSAAKIMPNDWQRIQRALEIFYISGSSASELQEKNCAAPSDYRYLNFALIPEERSWLHARIKERVDLMLANGLIDEVKKLRARGDLNPDLSSMRAVGYRQVWQYLDGSIAYDEMYEKILSSTRQLAKRQLTWLRSWRDIIQLHAKNGIVNNCHIIQKTTNLPQPLQGCE